MFLTFDHVDHDRRRFGVARCARVVTVVRELRFVHRQNGAARRELDINAGLLVVIYHAALTIPEDVKGPFRCRHELAFQTKAGALFHVQIGRTWYYRVRLRDFETSEVSLHRMRRHLQL